MPAPFGIVPEGFSLKTQEEIITDLEAGYRGTFGAGVNLEASESTFGSEIGIFSERLAELWQALQAVYNASFPDGAEEVNLTNIGAITGAAKLPATRTKVIVTVYPPPADVGSAGSTVVPANTELAIAGVGLKFRNAEPINLYSGGLIIASATGEFTAVDTGPTVVPAGSLTVINTPVVGLDHVTNLLDQSIKGTNLETDAEFRIRRENSLRGLGNNSADAVRAKLLAVPNVTDAFVFQNLTEVTDTDGVTPMSFEAVVAGGLEAAVAQVVFDSKPDASRSYGNQSTALLDSGGFTQIIKWSRPTNKNVYITINAKVGPGFPVDGVAQIKALVAATSIAVGQRIPASAFLKELDNIPGILEFPTLPLISFSASPTLSTTLVLSNREKASFDTSRISVVLS